MSKLEQFLSEEEFASLENARRALTEEAINITCVGLYNHGKSTLLNALVEDYDLKTFKASDQRETTEKQCLLFNGIQYIDTPGLNACEEDDAKVMEAIANSDITLFVHKLTTGEFNQVEMAFLQKIKRHWQNDKDFLQRTVFVLTCIDQVAQYEDIENTERKMNEQIRLVFGCDGHFTSISAKDYIEGQTCHEDLLVEESRFNQLIETIGILIKLLSPAIRATKQTRFEHVYDRVHQKLQGTITQYQQKISILRQQQQVQERELQKDLDRIEQTLTLMCKQLMEV